MKKTICIFLCSVLVLMGTSCSSNENQNNSETSQSSLTELTEPALPSDTSSLDNSEISSKTKEAIGIYDNVFISANSNPNSGVELTYDDVISNLDADQIDSFYSLEIIRVLSTDEAKKLKGWSTGKNDDNHTFYEAKIIKNLITGEEQDRTIFCSTLGSIEYQEEGTPPYNNGDVFAVLLKQKNEEEEITRSYADFLFSVDISISTNENIFSDDCSIAYKRNEPINLNDYEDIVVDNIDIEAISTTTLNPVEYSQKIDLNSLVDFYKQDWTSRGLINFDFNDIEIYNESIEVIESIEINDIEVATNENN